MHDEELTRAIQEAVKEWKKQRGGGNAATADPTAQSGAERDAAGAPARENTAHKRTWYTIAWHNGVTYYEATATDRCEAARIIREAQAESTAIRATRTEQTLTRTRTTQHWWTARSGWQTDGTAARA